RTDPVKATEMLREERHHFAAKELHALENSLGLYAGNSHEAANVRRSQCSNFFRQLGRAALRIAHNEAIGSHVERRFIGCSNLLEPSPMDASILVAHRKSDASDITRAIRR